jgi:uncharacterized protein (TIGR02466 family)
MIKNFNIEYLFPTTIYTSKNVCDSILESLKFETFQIKENYGVVRTPSLNVDSIHTNCANINWNEYEYFSILRKNIQYHIDNYINSLGDFHRKVSISNFWFNISNKGDFNFPHSHPGSIISGVFYIESEGDSILRFYNNHYLVSNFMTSNNSNEMSFTGYDVVCEKSTLMLWPSHVIHGNPLQTTEGLKIAVSFNTQFE